MRYNIGLGVGHVYAHGQSSFDVGGCAADGRIVREDELENTLPGLRPSTVLTAESDSEDSSVDYEMDSCEDDWADDDDIDDEELFAMDEMYR